MMVRGPYSPKTGSSAYGLFYDINVTNRCKFWVIFCRKKEQQHFLINSSVFVPISVGGASDARQKFRRESVSSHAVSNVIRSLRRIGERKMGFLSHSKTLLELRDLVFLFQLPFILMKTHIRFVFLLSAR